MEAALEYSIEYMFVNVDEDPSVLEGIIVVIMEWRLSLGVDCRWSRSMVVVTIV